MFIFTAPKRRFKSLSEDEIISLKYGDKHIKAYQIVYAYDTEKQNWSGMIMTNTTVKELAKSTGKWTGKLYIKAKNAKGKWELTLPTARIKELDGGIIWFKHDGCVSVQILEKPTKDKTW